MNRERNTLGPDYMPKTDGREADALAVAQTACYLWEKSAEPPYYMAARHAVALHVISGRLHRIAERECNEDWCCEACGGDGDLENVGECHRCAGTGRRFGRRTARLVSAARAIASLYGLSVFHQTDPRGCSLYIGHADDMTDSTYNRGHAVARLGR